MSSPDLDPDHTLDPRTRGVADRLSRRAGAIDLGTPMVEVVVARRHRARGQGLRRVHESSRRLRRRP